MTYKSNNLFTLRKPPNFPLFLLLRPLLISEKALFLLNPGFEILDSHTLFLRNSSNSNTPLYKELLSLKPESLLSFSKVFYNSTLYKETIIKECPVNRSNQAFLCIGNKASGKSFLLFGNKKESGLLCLFLKELFIDKKDRKVFIKAIEYNHNKGFKDLLVGTDGLGLGLEGEVIGAIGLELTGLEEALQILKLILRNWRKAGGSSKSNKDKNERKVKFKRDHSLNNGCISEMETLKRKERPISLIKQRAPLSSFISNENSEEKGYFVLELSEVLNEEIGPFGEQRVCITKHVFIELNIGNVISTWEKALMGISKRENNQILGFYRDYDDFSRFLYLIVKSPLFKVVLLPTAIDSLSFQAQNRRLLQLLHSLKGLPAKESRLMEAEGYFMQKDLSKRLSELKTGDYTGKNNVFLTLEEFIEIWQKVYNDNKAFEDIAKKIISVQLTFYEEYAENMLFNLNHKDITNNYPLQLEINLYRERITLLIREIRKGNLKIGVLKRNIKDKLGLTPYWKEKTISFCRFIEKGMDFGLFKPKEMLFLLKSPITATKIPFLEESPFKNPFFLPIIEQRGKKIANLVLRAKERYKGEKKVILMKSNRIVLQGLNKSNKINKKRSISLI